MKILSKSRKPLSFDEMIRALMGRPPSARARLLATTLSTGYYTEGTFLTRLSSPERRDLENFIRNCQYSGEEEGPLLGDPLDLSKSLPKLLGAKVSQESPVSLEGERMKLILLQGGEVEVLVEARRWVTLRSRHPDTDSFFARKDPSASAVVFLGRGLGEEGSLRAAVKPVEIKGGATPSSSGGGASWSLIKGQLRYAPL